MTWRRLPYLVRRTAGMDLDQYYRQPRSMTLRRVLGTVFPNLKRPVFVLGAARSGTTFLGDCLAKVPELSYHFEPVATKAASRCVYEGQWGPVKAGFFYRLVYAWLMRIHADGDLRFVEKTPRNCCIVPFLRRTFPDAQFIHIIRDGRDATLSLSKKPWLAARSADSGKYEPGGYPYGPYARFWVEPDRREEFETTSDIHRCIWAWKRYTEDAIAATQDLSPTQLLEIRYEDFASDPQDKAAEILSFLGIDSSEAKQQFGAAIGTFKPQLTGQWQQSLDPQALSEIRAEAGPLLTSLGYG